MNELRDAEINPDCICWANLLDTRFLRVLRVVINDDADGPVTGFLFVQDDLCDVSVLREWAVVVEVEVTDCGEVHDRVTSSVRVMIHVKTGLVIRGTGAIPRRSRRGYAPSQRQFPTVFVPFQNNVSASVDALGTTTV